MWHRIILAVTLLPSDNAEGLNNAPGFCGSPVENVGGLAVRADPGIFNGSLSLQFYIYALQGPAVPDIVLKIASDEVRPDPCYRVCTWNLTWATAMPGVPKSGHMPVRKQTLRPTVNASKQPREGAKHAPANRCRTSSGISPQTRCRPALT